MSGRSLMEGILWFPVSMTDEYPEEDDDASSIPNFQEEFCDKDLSTLQAVLNVFITCKGYNFKKKLLLCQPNRTSLRSFIFFFSNKKLLIPIYMYMHIYHGICAMYIVV